MVQAGVLNSPYGATTVSVAPTMPANAFATLSNGLANTTAAQMIMTPAGQVISSLPAGFGENLTNLKMNLQAEPTHSNLLLSNSTSLKDDITAFQLASLSSLTSTSGATRFNGSIKSESREETLLNASNLSEQTSSSDVTSVSEVSSYSLSFIYIAFVLPRVIAFLSAKPLELAVWFQLDAFEFILVDFDSNFYRSDFFHVYLTHFNWFYCLDTRSTIIEIDFHCNEPSPYLVRVRRFNH